MVATSESIERYEPVDNFEAFQSLRKRWLSAGEPKFSWELSGDKSVLHANPFAIKSFWNWDYEDLDVKGKFAEGGQAEIYEAWGIQDGEQLVMKVFKAGSSVLDLQKQWPHGMLGDESTRCSGYFSGGECCNRILGATLTKSGRFAFIMPKYWGDMRKLIDLRMEHNKKFNTGPPFPHDVAIRCMWQIAKGMQVLHSKDLLHRDLKASNVLIQEPSRHRAFNPILDTGFHCKLADFECSIGVVGTRFWRAPEILLALKNRTVDVTPELFTKGVDVYSYAMTCYEILTSGIPFEGYRDTGYDAVLCGDRPKLPSNILPWLEELLNRCWHMDPSKRPPFEAIVDVLEQNIGFQLD